MSSLSPYLTGGNLAATVIMVRSGQVEKRPIILTEGTRDQRVLKTAVQGCADLIPGHGKAETLDTLNHLDQNAVGGWLVVIVDADFDRLRGTQYPPLVLITDCHDMDCEHIKSYAFVKVIQELSSQKHCQKHFALDINKDPEQVGEKMRQVLLTLAKPLGLLRYLSHDEGFNLAFKGIDHRKMLLSDALEVDTDAMIKIVLSNTKNVTTDLKTLKVKLATLFTQPLDQWQVCQGHDLCRLLVIALRRYWGIGKLTVEEIERSIRIAYESAFFWATDLGKSLDAFLKTASTKKSPSLV